MSPEALGIIVIVLAGVLFVDVAVEYFRGRNHPDIDSEESRRNILRELRRHRDEPRR